MAGGALHKLYGEISRTLAARVVTANHHAKPQTLAEIFYPSSGAEPRLGDCVHFCVASEGAGIDRTYSG
jgi:hypothetical protein